MELPELKIIADAIKSLKEKGIIRTKNLVGDLGEYYCKEFFNLTLNKNVVETGYDAIDKNDDKVEIKTRRMPEPIGKVIFRGFNFNYCLFVELNEFYEPILILKIPVEEIKNNLDIKGDRLPVKRLKTKTKHEVVFPKK